MKTILSLLVCISLLAMSGQAYSQNGGDKKPLNNPMYSTHNYKHPNMAAKARSWENKTGVAVQQPTPTDARYANYKNQMPNAQPVGGITVDHTPAASLADRNYKIQRVSEPNAPMPSNEYYVKKRKNADTTDTNVGN
ncbi:hypothetical protein [Spirosoma fluviale]|uniref:Uncharacterized protein n=1 Tax=Spirosoma fluviale TaxID=1597977 RepID=A0A286FC62_9BACT|nr:hypothetical protein [Spirosoma fluviale]SOD80773.1 hypothetical protein SAMN06269250_1562 [Spirosoma fluviale]